MATEVSSSGGSRRTFPWRVAALYALALVFLGVVIWRSRVWEAGDTIERVGAGTALLVPLLSIVISVPLALRQREVMLALGHRFSALSLAPITYYGNTVGFMTPAASGELLRPALFERSFGVTAPRAAGAVLFERLFSMYLFCLSALAGFAWTGVLPVGAAIAVSAIVAAAPIVPLIAIRGLGLRMTALLSLVPGFVRRRLKGIDDAAGTLEALFRSPRLAVSFTALSGAVFAVMLLQFWLIVDAAGHSVSPAETWTVITAATLAGMLSGLPLGLGAGDAVMVSLLSAYGVDVKEAGAVTILVRCLINLPTGLFGLTAYLITLRQRSASPGREQTPEEAGPTLATGADRPHVP